ncbi:GTP-binding protein [Nannocystis punicea]|uniref:GTP-binding protein n=1 Tax=Nannocystis punicea TaxID=2995304 RepID=A0ABY7HHY2_9BACT|nr:GTP-binding protein [Nannocystis poenicansa]WAS98821.1 GTP-binding protein [Nannocystis poenicansa]
MTPMLTGPRRPLLAVATIGHHRHGKTTLTAAITRALARRGEPGVVAFDPGELDRRSGCTAYMLGAFPLRPIVTVRGTSVAYANDRRMFVHVDCPGRRPWLRDAARCIGLVDAVILVVSARESVQAQTREHLLVARALGVEQVVGFIGQCDAVRDPGRLDAVERDTRELLDACGFDGDATALIRGSAEGALVGAPEWQAGIVELIEALTREVALPVRDSDGPALLYVHWRRLSRVRCRVTRGSVRVGQPLTYVGLETSDAIAVDSITVYRQSVETVSAGQFAEFWLESRTTQSRYRWPRTGDALVDGEALPTRTIEAQLELLRPELGGRTTAIGDGHTAHLLFGAVAVGGTLHFVGAARLEPGEVANVVIELMRPVYLEADARFVVSDGSQGAGWRPGSPATWGGTVGSGRVTRVRPG